MKGSGFSPAPAGNLWDLLSLLSYRPGWPVQWKVNHTPDVTCVHTKLQKNPGCLFVPVGSSSGGGNVAVYVFDVNQPSLPTPFLCSCAYFRLYGHFNCIYSINFTNNPLLSHSVLLVLFLPLWSFQLYYISLSFMKVSFSSDIILCGWQSLEHQLTNLAVSSGFILSSPLSSVKLNKYCLKIILVILNIPLL